MKSASSEYKQIMKRPWRNRGHIEVYLGVINQDAQAGATVEAELLWYSGNDVFSGNTYSSEYATLEQNYWKADGTMFFQAESDPREQNLITEELLGTVTLNFDNTYDIKGITIDFGEYYPTSLQIVSNGETFTYENSADVFSCDDVFYQTNSLEIIPLTMVGGQQRLRISRIIMGVGLLWENEDIASATLEDYTNAISEETPYTKFTLNVLDPNNLYNVDSTSSTINFLETGQSVNIRYGLELDNETIEWLQMANLFLTDWKSTRGNMQFVASDRISFLDGTYDGSYSIYSRTLYDEAVTVLTSAGLDAETYEIDEVLKDITIVNPLPKTTYAQALQLIANAGRCLIRQDKDGVVRMEANYANILEPDDITITTVGATEYSNTENLKTVASIIYADMTQDFWSADGSMYFLPQDSTYLDDTGFVSAEVADSDGLFETNPSITLSMDAGYTYYGVIIYFAGNAPQEIVIHTFFEGESVQDETFSELVSGKNVLNAEFSKFDTMTIEFTVGAANDRVLVQKVAFGDLSDYELRLMDMFSSPVGHKEEKAKSVSVKVYSYETVDDKIQEVEDDVWETYGLNTTGTDVRFQNPLISTAEHAQLVAEWIGNYYANNISYNVEFRGEPRINAGDIIFMESDEMQNLQVDVENTRLTFNGGFRGSLELRRAMKGVDLD